eukprot:2598361-Rhodomonas_salina.3
MLFSSAGLVQPGPRRTSVVPLCLYRKQTRSIPPPPSSTARDQLIYTRLRTATFLPDARLASSTLIAVQHCQQSSPVICLAVGSDTVEAFWFDDSLLYSLLPPLLPSSIGRIKIK